MKALRLVLAGLMICTNVLAAPTGKLLVVQPDVPQGTDNRYISAIRFDRLSNQVMRRLGINYKEIDTRDMKAQWGKTGVAGWGFGKVTAATGTHSETFDAVMWRRINAGTQVAASGARGDSLLNSRRVSNESDGINGLQVPNLFLLDDYLVAQSAQTMQATCCTTGVNNIDSADLWIYGLQHPVGTRQGWITGGLFQRTMTRKVGTTAAGGYRPMLVANQPAIIINQTSGNPYYNVNCAFCDSIPFANAATGDDSVIVFSLPFSNITGSKPLIVAYADGNGEPGGDSLSNAYDPGLLTAEVDPTVILYALAALDSAAGGTLFDSDKLPIKLGLVIEAANVYGGNRAGPGIPPQDSANLAATIDSMAAHEALGGVKYRPTVAINVAGVSGAGDSLNGTGAYSKAWLNRWRTVGAKFTPQSWAGILNVAYRRASAGVGDILGYADSRAFVGDFDQTTGTADTSVAQQLKWAKRLLVEAGVDPNEMSKTLVAPLLDWAPVNKSAFSDRDSALYAFRLAGYTTVISDANLVQSNPGKVNGTAMSSATYRGVSNGLMGYTSVEGVYRDAGGGLVTVLASNGHDITGGTMHAVTDDSSNTTLVYGVIGNSIYRTVSGLLTPRDHWNSDAPSSGADVNAASYYTTAKDLTIAHTLINPGPGEPRPVYRKGSILRLTTADLSGCTGCARGAPARNGWWVIKSLKNWMDAVNNAAGRTVITWDYCENIDPTP